MTDEGLVRYLIGRLWPVYCERIDESIADAKGREWPSEDYREGVMEGLRMARGAFPGYSEGILPPGFDIDDHGAPEDPVQTASWNPLHRFRRTVRWMGRTMGTGGRWTAWSATWRG